VGNRAHGGFWRAVYGSVPVRATLNCGGRKWVFDWRARLPHQL
jgi:hypothetical protein